jgi:hypothetical protein
VEQSQKLSKRKLVELDAKVPKCEKVKAIKTERDQKQLEILKKKDENPVHRIKTAYEKLMEETKIKLQSGMDY